MRAPKLRSTHAVIGLREANRCMRTWPVRGSMQYDAAAWLPMPQKDVQHERENAFID
ncbi:hypothetical protein B0G76_2782 [Paraburkholderia sp. BL23I1N1]|nr:hypothetical protein B0G76_2782 [Paraburkholderia sp. BL23I1N1]